MKHIALKIWRYLKHSNYIHYREDLGPRLEPIRGAGTVIGYFRDCRYCGRGFVDFCTVILILALALPIAAQELPDRVAFLGTGWTARQASPTTGFAGLGVKVTDAIGGLYQWNSIIATSKTNSFASGLLKPVGRVGPFTGWIAGQAGLASGAGSVALTYGGGGLASAQLMDLAAMLHLPWRPQGTFFAGLQVNQINSGNGIPFSGVNISPGFGFAIPWGK